MKKPILFALALFAALGLSGCKELEPVIDQVKPLLEEHTGVSTGLTSGQIAQAIKQALNQGVGDSVNLLGRTSGFSTSSLYRIPIPEALQKPATILRQFGQGQRVDEFESRLNLAAEQSVAQALPIFRDAISGMTVSDAIGIMQGPDNAATQYFRSRTETNLRAKFLPIIQDTTSASGLTSTYKSMSDKIATYAPDYRSQLVNIDDYVLDRAMTALFDRIAIEEKLIRENPAKRTTELMQSVYGHYAKK